MTQVIPKLLTFAEFVEWYPANSSQVYELHDGVIIEMPQPVGQHEEIVGFLAKKLILECDRLNLPYFIAKTALVKPLYKASGYFPDLLLINDLNLKNEPLWQSASTVSLSNSIPLVVEVVSTNWEDDYYTKLGNYEAMKIPEYWIVDYAGLGAKKFIGNPKKPTLSIYNLIEDEYQVKQFKDEDIIESANFPNLKLQVDCIFRAGKNKRL
jgi:Uma2 family endonuclease